ncbi:MAG: hypothetical protein EOO26_05570 [Comamonadaceae bacterium]|nr:MAG: hypothetical protein EOO26_05570 [Comamonadaceae bacterium]
MDDAGTLDVGQCQYEVWGSRVGRDAAVRGLHLGPACRVGPVELGLGVDLLATRGERTTTYVGPQLKWTVFGQHADDRLAAALSIGTTFDATRGGRAGGQFVIPLTWRALDNLQLHANFGADWAPGTGARTGRGGVQVEWALDQAVSLIAERHRAYDVWTTRIGARFSVTPSISIDLSAARIGRAEERQRGFVIGLNHEFSR